ncbi:helix-turn-helix domain-containing protein [Psychromarinibacter sp. C21-152]|uniref:Helix-turn-helix domain-containing protein n=1 Tax=Psychromarinibacter sediminicola TaxID=3033385 RepID=A0AAE3NNQ8_9RHOB|nr:helix-turn-helix domain-containing protein [Psychromarinibacter sediminicola]MDF0601368.1 helix-turn-helix domain-containing protein [Psychromarinibacter sediminicola]
MPEPDQLTIAVVVTPEVTASTVFGIYDMFASAGRDWAFLTRGEAGPRRARTILVARRARPVQVANGVWLRPEASFRNCPLPDIVYVPELFVPAEAPPGGRFGPERRWLRHCHARGATLTSACSGTLMLAEAGLLDGQAATTHWAYCDGLAARHPEIDVQPNRFLVASGEGQRIITAGGVTSYLDLGLFLIARFFGAEEAMRVARSWLIDWHSEGQLPFASLARAAQTRDGQIAEMQDWIAEHYADPAPVAQMVGRSGLSERTFKRRFKQATGLPPLDYVHSIRLEEAKQMLETTGQSVEEIAVAVGYEDDSFFRRLFRRKVGLTPRAYRQRFQSVRVALLAAENGGR